jgi:hypothetical protein
MRSKFLQLSPQLSSISIHPYAIYVKWRFLVCKAFLLNHFKSDMYYWVKAEHRKFPLTGHSGLHL